MTTPAAGSVTSRLIVVSYNGRCRRFDLDGEGRLSFAHIARVFRIPINAPDDCDTWTLDETSLRIDKSDPGALLTVSALRDLFPMPAGTNDQPLALRTDDTDEPDAVPQLPPHTQPQVQAPRITPRRVDNDQRLSAEISLSPATRGVVPPAASNSPLRTGMLTPRFRGNSLLEQLPVGPGYQTPGAASPLRGARTPLGLIMIPQSSPGCLPRQPNVGGAMELVRPTTGAQGDLFRHPRGQGTFYFTTAAAQHLPMLMACHLSPPLQRLLRHFSVPAQCAITARAMALYSRTSHLEYFRDQRLEAALTESRSHNPPQDRYCAYTLQAVRLTGRKRKPGASPHANAVAASPLTPRVAMAAAAATPALPGCLDVDMDTGGWSFVGGATLHCPGGAAGRKSGRHENWLLSDGADGGVTYLPVLYDNEEHSAVLLPLADPPANGCRAGEGNTPTRPPCVEKTLLWFRYEYESRGGRRGHNFWDKGLPEHLEQAIRDVAGEDALRAARGA